MRKEHGLCIHGTKRILCEDFSSKKEIPILGDNRFNYYSVSLPHPNPDNFMLVRKHKVEYFLLQLCASNATGSDGIGAKVLRFLTKELSYPIVKIIRRILCSGEWPEVCLHHWISPMCKCGSMADEENYRGVHLTSQVSKVVQSVLAHNFVAPFVRPLYLFGQNQFAYTRQHGCRDVIAFLITSWLIAFAFTKNPFILFRYGRGI